MHPHAPSRQPRVERPSWRHLLTGALMTLGLAGLCGACLAQAADYPSRPITLVVGYPPGGSTDLTGRALADELARHLKVPVVVENVGGAGGTVGAQRVVHAAPDGYTLLLGANNEVLIAQHVNRKLRYDGRKDLTAIGLVATQPMVLVASAASGLQGLDDFVDTVRKSPGRFSYGSSGVGTALHLTGELIKDKAGLFMVHIPYRGVGPLSNDLLGDRLELGVYVLSSGLPHIRAGRVKAIGTSEARRSTIAPDIPALAEHPSLRGLDLGVWFMLTGPAGLPDKVQDTLRSALTQALRSPGLRGKLEASGSTIISEQPDLARFLEEEAAKYQHIVQFARIEQ